MSSQSISFHKESTDPITPGSTAMHKQFVINSYSLGPKITRRNEPQKFFKLCLYLDFVQTFCSLSIQYLVRSFTAVCILIKPRTVLQYFLTTWLQLSNQASSLVLIQHSPLSAVSCTISSKHLSIYQVTFLFVTGQYQQIFNRSSVVIKRLTRCRICNQNQKREDNVENFGNKTVQSKHHMSSVLNTGQHLLATFSRKQSKVEETEGR